MDGWRSPAEIFKPTLDALTILAPHIPILINETASTEHGGDKAIWIADLFDMLSRCDSVVGVVWFNIEKSSEADWRLETSSSSIDATAAALRSW